MNASVETGDTVPARSQRRLSIQSVVVRREGVIATEVDQEAVAMNPETGRFLAMNRVASRIWSLTGTATSIGGICAALARDYDVAAEHCERKVMELIENFRAEGLVRIVGEDPSGTPFA